MNDENVKVEEFAVSASDGAHDSEINALFEVVESFDVVDGAVRRC